MEVAKAAGLYDHTQTHGKNCVTDFDEDGEEDLILSTHREGGWKFNRGLGGGAFTLDHSVAFPERDRHSCAVADFNMDGLLDVYMSIGTCQGTCQAAKELWIQQPDRTFVDEALAWGVADPDGRGRVAVVLDANGDRLPDLFTAQEEPVDYPSMNRLWLNHGDHFELAEIPLVNSTGHFASAADIDGDGLDELALCTPEDGFFLYRNDDGDYVDATEALGLESYGRRTAEFVDVNGDGSPDLATVTSGRVQIHINEGGSFGDATFTAPAPDGKDAAFGDIDGDGDLDMYLLLGNDSPDHDLVFVNVGDGEFAEGPTLPVATGGAGNSVTAVPNWKGTGRAAFIVNNGWEDEPGPLPRQVFEFTDG